MISVVQNKTSPWCLYNCWELSLQGEVRNTSNTSNLIRNVSNCVETRGMKARLACKVCFGKGPWKCHRGVAFLQEPGHAVLVGKVPAHTEIFPFFSRDIDKVDELMQDIAEQQELADEISTAISKPVGFGEEFDEVWLCLLLFAPVSHGILWVGKPWDQGAQALPPPSVALSSTSAWL